MQVSRTFEEVRKRSIQALLLLSLTASGFGCSTATTATPTTATASTPSVSAQTTAPQGQVATTTPPQDFAKDISQLIEAETAPFYCESKEQLMYRGKNGETLSMLYRAPGTPTMFTIDGVSYARFSSPLPTGSALSELLYKSGSGWLSAGEQDSMYINALPQTPAECLVQLASFSLNSLVGLYKTSDIDLEARVTLPLSGLATMRVKLDKDGALDFMYVVSDTSQVLCFIGFDKSPSSVLPEVHPDPETKQLSPDRTVPSTLEELDAVMSGT
jgi:hypothetical protein